MKRCITLICIAFITSCRNESVQKNNPLSQQELIALNKEMHLAEMSWIRNYIASLNLPMHEGTTGFFYAIIEQGKNDSIRPGDEIEMDYHIFNLTHPAFTQEISHDRKVIKVENDNTEAGIHQALQFLTKGDSAIFIIPSHLAFGLTGNQMVNPNTPLLYTVRVMSDTKAYESK